MSQIAELRLFWVVLQLPVLMGFSVILRIVPGLVLHIVELQLGTQPRVVELSPKLLHFHNIAERLSN